jgi:hypothetical protein
MRNGFGEIDELYSTKELRDARHQELLQNPYCARCGRKQDDHFGISKMNCCDPVMNDCGETFLFRKLKRYTVRNQQLHPQYVEDLKQTPAGQDIHFGNTVYKTHFAVLYGIREER